MRKQLRKEYRFPPPHSVVVVRNGRRQIKSLWDLTWWD
jgi:hypothetical protein